MNKRQMGEYYEDAAIAFLENNKISIIGKNVHCGKIGEIDIIGMDQGADYGRTLVFFEVKYRKNGNYGYAAEAVDGKKQNTIRKCASYYTAFKNWSGYIRFDVIAIDGDEINWIKNAF